MEKMNLRLLKWSRIIEKKQVLFKDRENAINLNSSKRRKKSELSKETEEMKKMEDRLERLRLWQKKKEWRRKRRKESNKRNQNQSVDIEARKHNTRFNCTKLMK